MLFSIAVVVPAQDDDPKDLLRRVSLNVQETVGRLPKYVCTQTINRIEYQPPPASTVPSCDRLAAERKAGKAERRVASSDRLRIDVAAGLTREAFGVTDEMYSWVGANHFDDRGLSELVRRGAYSTGSFLSFLVTIFGGNIANFSYDGDKVENGRALVEFGFQFPLEKSNMMYFYGLGGEPNRNAAAAYEGSFSIDPKTLDLVRLAVRISPPRETGACEANQVLDYSRVNLNGNDFLLPREARLDILNLDGKEMANRISYSSCHEFRGQSTVSFEAPPDTTQTPAEERPEPLANLPPGIPFKLSFNEAIDSGKAAAGDVITARLTTPIGQRTGPVLVPQGALVTARIVKAQHVYGKERLFILAIKLESVNVEGTVRTLRGTTDSGVRRFAQAPGSLTPRINLGPIDLSQDRDAGVLEFRGKKTDFVIAKGFESSWITLAP